MIVYFLKKGKKSVTITTGPTTSMNIRIGTIALLIIIIVEVIISASITSSTSTAAAVAGGR